MRSHSSRRNASISESPCFLLFRPDVEPCTIGTFCLPPVLFSLGLPQSLLCPSRYCFPFPSLLAMQPFLSLRFRLVSASSRGSRPHLPFLFCPGFPSPVYVHEQLPFSGASFPISPTMGAYSPFFFCSRSPFSLVPGKRSPPVPPTCTQTFLVFPPFLLPTPGRPATQIPFNLSYPPSLSFFSP